MKRLTQCLLFLIIATAGTISFIKTVIVDPKQSGVSKQATELINTLGIDTQDPSDVAFKLVLLLKDSPSALRQDLITAALNHLQNRWQENWWQLTIRGLEATDITVRWDVAQVLIPQADDFLAAQGIQLLDHPKWTPKLSQQVIPMIGSRILTSTKSHFRHNSITLIGRIFRDLRWGYPESFNQLSTLSLPVFQELLSDEDTTVRLSAAQESQSLSTRGHTLIPQLVSLAKSDPLPNVRIQALRAIASVATDPDLIKSDMLEILANSDLDQGFWTLRTLHSLNIKDPKIISEINRLLQLPDRKDSKFSSERKAYIVQFLGSFGLADIKASQSLLNRFVQDPIYKEVASYARDLLLINERLDKNQNAIPEEKDQIKQDRENLPALTLSGQVKLESGASLNPRAEIAMVWAIEDDCHILARDGFTSTYDPNSGQFTLTFDQAQLPKEAIYNLSPEASLGVGYITLIDPTIERKHLCAGTDVILGADPEHVVSLLIGTLPKEWRGKPRKYLTQLKPGYGLAKEAPPVDIPQDPDDFVFNDLQPIDPNKKLTILVPKDPQEVKLPQS